MENEISTKNPMDGTVLSRFRKDSDSDVDQKLEAAYQAYLQWRELSVASRCEFIARLASAFRSKLEPMAEMISREMGKPIRQARAEVEKCASVCDWVSKNADTFLTAESLPFEGAQVQIAYRPLGPILAVMPWNFPFWQVMRATTSLVAGGNPVVLKHASQVLGCAEMLTEAFSAAGFPKGIFTHAHADHVQTGKIIGDRRVRGVTVTGSGGAGKKIASMAGSFLKKCVLELGGSDAFIVLGDVDIESVAAQAVTARFQNTGQVCIAAKRFIIEESIFNSFQEAFIEKVKLLSIGDPRRDDIDLGPMARHDLRDELRTQVEKSIQGGAKLVLGGGAVTDPDLRRGSFFMPTVLSEVTPSMVSFNEEMFGPVASLIRAKNSDHALALANQTDFGLSGSIWCGPGSMDRAQELSKRMETGGVFINKVPFTHPAVPVGGIKDSGYGRELSGLGLREFVNIQTLWRA